MTDEIIDRTLFHLQQDEVVQDFDPAFEFRLTNTCKDNPALRRLLIKRPEWWGDEKVIKTDIRTTHLKLVCSFFYLEGGLVYFELVNNDEDTWWGFTLPEYVEPIFSSWDDQPEWKA